MIYHVVAMARNRVIGKANRLPWHFSADLQHFKKLTTGQTVLMGRKTYESIGKPFPHRENFVVSRTIDGCYVFPSIDSALKNVRTEHCYIIGGAQIFEQTLGLVHGIYLTRIDADYEGDAFYPEIPKNFAEQSREKLQDQPLIEVLFYERRA